MNVNPVPSKVKNPGLVWSGLVWSGLSNCTFQSKAGVQGRTGLV